MKCDKIYSLICIMGETIYYKLFEHKQHKDLDKFCKKLQSSFRKFAITERWNNKINFDANPNDPFKTFPAIFKEIPPFYTIFTQEN